MRPRSLLPALSLSALSLSLLLLPSAASAQSTSVTETLPPASVQAPARPVPPKPPAGAAMPRMDEPALNHRLPGSSQTGGQGSGNLVHDLLRQQLAGLPASPKLPGNDAFGAVQEILAILEADPKTDWGRVNLDALRAHLIDMNELTLNAEARVEAIAGGIRVTITGQGRTLGAIQRMVPAHAREIDGHDGWHVTAEEQPDGAILTVTAKDARQTAKIRGLGFIGVLATGAHHQQHHLAIARGQPMHGTGHDMGHDRGSKPKAN